MHVVIAGGTGFIGSALAEALRARDDRVTVVSRRAGTGCITWDELRARGLPACDAAIHLSGEHILQPGRRWTEAYRAEVLGSRLRTTRWLVDAINGATRPPGVFISTVGKCLYGAASSAETLDEHDMRDTGDFPNRLSRAWAGEAARVRGDVRHVQLRLGIVFARSLPGQGPGPFRRGVFPMFRTLFERGLAFGSGDGTQGLPWVHIGDVVTLYRAALDRAEMHGPYNAVAPVPTTNGMFARALAERLGVPFRGFLPRQLIHAVIGAERVGILTHGQFVHPARTLASGFSFRFATLETALDELVGAPEGSLPYGAWLSRLRAYAGNADGAPSSQARPWA